MHEARIAGLEKRLRNLREKEKTGRYAADAIAVDRAVTEAELAALRGIQQRNAALVVQAPGMAAAEDAAVKGRRRRREAAQFTPGQKPTPKGA